MSNCLRHLENDSYWIVYNSNSDCVFPYLFDSSESGRMFINAWEKIVDNDIEKGESRIKIFESHLTRIGLVVDIEMIKDAIEETGVK